jgi:hypothetical protein
MIHYNTPSQHHRRIIILYIIRSQHRLPIQYPTRNLRRRHMRPIITITVARCIRSTFLVIMALLPGLLPN